MLSLGSPILRCVVLQWEGKERCEKRPLLGRLAVGVRASLLKAFHCSRRV